MMRSSGVGGQLEGPTFLTLLVEYKWAVRGRPRARRGRPHPAPAGGKREGQPLACAIDGSI